MTAILASLDISTGEAQTIATTNPDLATVLPGADYSCIINRNKLNDIGPLNEFLRVTHSKLRDGGYLVGVVELMTASYKHLWDRYPGWLARLLYWFDYIVKRVIPALLPRNGSVVLLPRFRGGRIMSRTEVLGRLVYSGFAIEHTEQAGGVTVVVARKDHAPATDSPPATGPLLKLERLGQNGETIDVLKLRTMHPYAQYLQEFVYKENGLRTGGKLAEDFRITPWGKIFRTLWLDEIPMILNWLKGDLKLVGVRPLSSHYMGLYTAQHRQRRVRYKPGLFPPFYADLPESLGEILASEAQYFDAYDIAPIRTDLRYLLRGMYNILLKRARSN